MSLALLVSSTTGVILRDAATGTILWSTTEVHVTRPGGILLLPWGLVAIEACSSFLYVLGYYNKHIVHKSGVAGNVVCLGAHGPWVFGGCEDGTLLVWHSPSGRLVNNLKTSYGGITAMKVCLCGGSVYIALGTGDGCVVIYPLPHLCHIGQLNVVPLHVHYVHQGPVTGIDFIHPGTNDSSEIRIVSVGLDHKVALLRIGGNEDNGNREAHITDMKMKSLEGVPTSVVVAPQQTHLLVSCFPEILTIPLSQEVKQSSFRVKDTGKTSEGGAVDLVSKVISVDVNPVANVMAVGNGTVCQLFSLSNIEHLVPLSTFTVEGSITNVKLVHLVSVSGVTSVLDTTQQLWKGPASGFPPPMGKYPGRELVAFEDIPSTIVPETLNNLVDITVQTRSGRQSLGIDLTPFNNSFLAGLMLLDGDTETTPAEASEIRADIPSKARVSSHAEAPMKIRTNEHKKIVVGEDGGDSVFVVGGQTGLEEMEKPIVLEEKMDLSEEAMENAKLMENMLDRLLDLYSAL